MIVGLIVLAWAALALLALILLSRVCRSGDYEDHHRHYGGDRQLVTVPAGVPAPRHPSLDDV